MSQSVKWGGALLALALVGCDGPVKPVDPAVTPVAEERATREALVAEFDAAAAVAAATQGPGSPALWTLSDEDTVIHLFGTVHLLRPELNWRSEAIDEALNAADTVVFEVDMKSEEAQRRLMSDFLARGMYADGGTLRAALNETDEAIVEAAMDKIGVPLDAFNSFEPWMAAVNLSVMQLQNDGFDPTAGVEQVIEAIAVQGGKSFDFMEDISDQADAFDLLPEAAQIDFLVESALILDLSASMLDKLVAEWAEGDVAGIAAIGASPDVTGGGREIYESILVNRNAKWVPKIEAMLETPGTVFIAVGAGHLAGPDSVIKMLRDKGYEVTGP